jgi:hypothetical protein
MFMPPQKTTPTSKPSVTREQIDWNEMINLYMYKDVSSVGSVEGIYSISGLVTRTGKGFLGAGEEKEKVVDRKENYAKVAIIRDPARTSREFVELLMDGETTTSMDVIGEFSSMSKGNIMVYKHFDQKGKEFDTYTFTYDQDKDFLEGVRTETKGNATITYKLTYLKILPKR